MCSEIENQQPHDAPVMATRKPGTVSLSVVKLAEVDLATVSVLRHVGKRAMMQVARAVAASSCDAEGQLRVWHAGEEIISQGELGTDMYVVHTGACQAHIVQENGRRVSTFRLDEPRNNGGVASFFGDPALRRVAFGGVTSSERQASVVAIEPTTLWVVTPDAMRMGGEPLAALPGQLSEKLAASELDSGSMTRKKKWQAAAQSDMLGLSSFSFDGADSDKWSDLTSSVLHSMPKEVEFEPDQHLAENQKMIVELFNSLDKDSSGSVEKKEFKKIFEMVEDLDQLDDSAFATAMLEINAAMADNTESRSFGVNCSLSSLMEDTMEYFFTELDKDGDGTFDLAEFSDLVRILADEEGHVLQDWLIDRMQDLRVHCDSEHGAEHGPAH